MIPDIFIFVIGLLSHLVVLILKLIPFAIPNSWETAITQAISYFGYWQGWLPIFPDPTKDGLWASVGIMTILGWFITAIVAVYLMKGAVMMFHMFTLGHVHLKIPSFGKGRSKMDN